MEPASSSVRMQCSRNSSPRQYVSITFSVCFPFVSSRLYSTVASPSRHVTSFEMVVFILSTMSCPTCSTIRPASSFAMRCPRCSSSVTPAVSTSFFTLITENSPSASSASASVFSLLECAAAFLFRRFSLIWLDSLCAASIFLSVWSLLSCFIVPSLSSLFYDSHPFSEQWSWKLPWHICGHNACGSCRWLLHLCCISSVFSCFCCSRFSSRFH